MVAKPLRYEFSQRYDSFIWLIENKPEVKIFKKSVFKRWLYRDLFKSDLLARGSVVILLFAWSKLLPKFLG